jgi:hypothetical protein
VSGDARQLGWGLALLAVLSGAGARAADKHPRIALLHVAADPATTGDAIENAIASRLRERGFDPTFPTAAIETTCTEGACLANLIRDCRAELLLRAALDVQGAGGTLTLTLFDKTGQALSEISKTVADRSPASLADAVEEEIPKLVQPLPGAEAPTAGPAVGQGTPAEHSHVAGYALMASGAALLLASGAVGYAADSADSALDNAVNGEAAGNIPALRSSVSTEAWVSTGLTLAGVAAIVVGVVLFYTGTGGGTVDGHASAGASTLGWAF